MNESKSKMGVWGLPSEKCLNITILRTLENVPFNRYMLLYSYIYIESGSEETSTPIKTDTHQKFQDMNHFLANQNEKGTIYWEGVGQNTAK